MCAFHVKKAWALNLQQKVHSKEAMEMLRKDLDALMRYNPPASWLISPRRQADVEIQRVLAAHAGCPAFVAYFERQRPGKPTAVGFG